MSKTSIKLASKKDYPYYAYRCRVSFLLAKQSFYVTGFARYPIQFMSKVKERFPLPYFRIDDFHIIHNDTFIIGGDETLLTF